MVVVSYQTYLTISWLLACILASKFFVAASTTRFATLNSSPTVFMGQSKNAINNIDTNNTSQEQSDDTTCDTTAPTETNITTSQIPEWQKSLPPPLHNKTRTLRRIMIPGPSNRVVEIFLLGTAHVSNDSSRDVRLLLESTDPDVLFVELCDGRIPMLLPPPPPATAVVEEKHNTQSQQVEKGLLSRFRREKKKKSQEEPQAPRTMYGTAATLLTKMQQDYAESLDVELGGEFRVAYDYWDEHRKRRRLHMVLGDRPLYLTLTRAWESLRFWGKTKLLVGLIISGFQKPKPEELKAWMEKILSDDSGDLLTESIAELAEHFPTLEEVIIRERDAYMACKLYQTCRELLRSNIRIQKHRIVAIVGAGHVEGMCRWLTTPNEKTPEQILSSLIQIKKGIPEDDSQSLVSDVSELNHVLVQEMVSRQ